MLGRGELIDGGDDLGWVATDLIDLWKGVYEVEELDFAAIVELVR